MRRRAWLTLGAVVLGGAGVATYAVATPTDAPAQATAKARPSAVHTVQLKAQGGDGKGLPKESTEQFSAVMLSWSDERAELDGTAEFRFREKESGKWSAWQALPSDPLAASGEEAERAGLRGATESVWTGAADGIEVRVTAEDGTTSALPAGLDVKLLDPGRTKREAALLNRQGAGDAQPPAVGMEPAAFAAETTPPEPTGSAPASPSASASPSVSASPSPEPTETAPTAPTAPPSTVVKPPVLTQSEWGASTAYNGTPSYGTEIKAAVVHHTGVDSDNGLSCGQSRERVRSIQQGHLSQGWYDIGYNFLVDKCGQIFEGRSGGMDVPVVGAHDSGFNTDTVGISYIGNFEKAKPSRAGLDAIARIVAWKFGQYGVSPTGNATLTSGVGKGVGGNKYEEGQQVTLPSVLGHRDTNTTLCPGANLYPKLGLIRTLAATPGISHALATEDTDRNGVDDLVAGAPKASANSMAGAGTVTVVPGGLDGPAAAGTQRISQSSAGVPGSSETGDGFGSDSAWGDLNGDGYADLAIGSPGEDDTSGSADRGTVTLLYGPALNTGTSFTTSVVTRAGAKLGSTVTVGDFDADGKADVFSAGTGKGGNFNARLTDGAITAGTLTSATGAVSSVDATTGDFNRDGYADVAVNYRDTGSIGRVAWFKGGKAGLTKVGVLSVKGGRALAAGDVNANGYDDLVVGQPYTAESGAYAGGQVTVVPGTSTGFTTTGMKTVHQATSGVPGAAEAGDAMGLSVSAGDYDADGYADVLAGLPREDLTRTTSRTDAGTALLMKGTSSGLTGTGTLSFHQDTAGITGASESGDRLGSAVSLHDLSGYGRADLTLGVDGEDAGNGTLLYLPSGSAGIDPSKGVYYGRTTLGAQTGMRLGQQLTP